MKLRILVITHIDIYGAEPNGTIHAINSLLEWLEKFGTVDLYCMRPIVAQCRNKNINIHHPPHNIMDRVKVLLRTKYDNFLIRNIRGLFNNIFEKLICFYNDRKNATFYDHKKLEVLKQYLADRPDYDIVIIEYIQNGYLIDAFDSKVTTTFIDTHDLMHKRVKSYIKAGVAPAFNITKKEEYRMLSLFDYIMAIQHVEAEELQIHFGNKVLTVPRPMRTYGQYCRKKHSKKKLQCLFFASKAIFNLHAINWFIENVWNKELDQVIELILAGTICSVLPQNIRKNFTVLGAVESVSTAYEYCDFVINPIQIGSGLKIKNLEAMAHCRPVITTSLGAEGITHAENNGLWIIDDPDKMRNFIKTLPDNRYMIHEMGQKGLKLVQRYFNAKECFKELNNILLAIQSKSQTA